jgi:2,4-dienoyl-CoA reductase-like NADH-dependent reductase (Old Yellow Enzyme family)
MTRLFDPLTIRSVSFPNRLVVSPMCQYSSEDGFANDWHLVHLGSRAVGGAGLIIMEATAVVPEGRITPHDLGLWKDEQISALKRITRFIKAQGSVPGIQLAHAGRKASCSAPWKTGKQLAEEAGGWQIVAPSAVAFEEGTRLPAEMSVAAIEQLTKDFASAAKRAREAGFEVVEIHAAHGYLLHEFYSPLSNFRTDAYGGSFENRTRLLLEVVAAVQSEWPKELPLFVRISATDWVEGGWSMEDSVALATGLQKAGVDLIDCSSGGNIGYAKIPVAPGYQVPFASQIRKEADILTGAVGMITTAEQAEAIITNEEADLVLIARESLRDPYFPLRAASQLQQDIDWPVQYLRAKK